MPSMQEVQAWREPFLKALAVVPVIGYACNAAGIERTAVWRARAKDPEFDRECGESMEAGIDRAEQEAFRRAVTGYSEPVIDKGRVAYAYVRKVAENGDISFEAALDEAGQPVPLTINKHSDYLLSMILKGRRKKLYSERTELTGADGQPLPVSDSERTARISQIISAAKARKETTVNIDDIA